MNTPHWGLSGSRFAVLAAPPAGAGRVQLERWLQGTRLASLPVRVREAPVLILGARNATLGGLPGRWDAAEQQV